MSVYTPVDSGELANWLAPLGLGALRDYAAIAAGVQNSNYFVTTTSGRYVLTLFETLSAGELDFYLALQDRLARRQLPCPQPLAGADGARWRPLAGKPAALFTCLPGAAVETPSPAHCRAVGEMLAALHAAAAGFPEPLANPCGPAWWQATAAALLPLLPAAEGALLADELAFQLAQQRLALPRGVIHADLFRDNVLWEGERLSGVLDFYFAGEEWLLFDLAIVANDWCADDEQLAALLAGYISRRPLTDAEHAAWPAMRRAAALRFWLLRLEARYRPRAGAVVTIKNPEDFRRLLERFRLAPPVLPR